ncbi:MAG: hypothetical protein ABR529_05440 [Actinomycetota bacterium]
MSFSDFIRGFFTKKRNPQLAELEPFVTARKGVEGYIEPRTATQPTTLLLVDRDGASARAAVRGREDAVAFCERWSLPVYDAAVIGYPKRMVEYERRGGRSTDRLDEQIADLERRLGEPGGRETPDR